MPAVSVCRLDELSDGAVRRVMVGQRPVAVARFGQQVYACIDRCPHMGAAISDGTVNVGRREIICPWHRFRFQLDGGGTSATNSELKIQTYPARIDGGQVVVEIP
jgi:3-phenylpropionate/trans-cinnamate dioxygenase ferredoxin subunit